MKVQYINSDKDFKKTKNLYETRTNQFSKLSKNTGLQNRYEECDIADIVYKYLDAYYDEFEYLRYEYPNWGELDDFYRKDPELMEAFMAGDNWAGDLADKFWKSYLKDKKADIESDIEYKSKQLTLLNNALTESKLSNTSKLADLNETTHKKYVSSLKSLFEDFGDEDNLNEADDSKEDKKETAPKEMTDDEIKEKAFDFAIDIAKLMSNVMVDDIVGIAGKVADFLKNHQINGAGADAFSLGDEGSSEEAAPAEGESTPEEGASEENNEGGSEENTEFQEA